jgi:hypothetical protein
VFVILSIKLDKKGQGDDLHITDTIIIYTHVGRVSFVLLF